MQIQTLLIFFSILMLFFISIVWGIGFYIIRRYGNPLPKLFHEFDKKMWMTLGLGIIFFGFYLGLITVLSLIFKGNRLQKVFFFLYSHKVESIYIGLMIFALVTLSTHSAYVY